MISASKEMKEYFENLQKALKECYEIANKARSIGYDPVDKVEIPVAKNMAERVINLISLAAIQIKEAEQKVLSRVEELEKQYGAQDWRVAFKIAEEIALEKFCKFENKLKAAETGMRFGLAYITNGVVSSPLEGFIRLETKQRNDGNGEFFALYFGGPIRSAGTTAVCVFVALADYIRKILGYKEYDPTKEEIKRSSTEIQYFHDRITNLQYLPSEKEVEFLTAHLPVQIEGDPSEQLEVPNYKDLPRVSTNRLRNGYCLVMAEGLAQKLAKFWGKFSKWHKDFGMDHWGFVEEFIKLQKEIRSKGEVKKTKTAAITADYAYIKDIVGGRPILSYPLRTGGFRIRYGRCRNSGFSSDAIHPATMVVLKGYLAVGTQLRTERPGKSTVLSSCDTIEGPIVKLKNGDVLFLEDENQAKQVVEDVEEILFLGDILINYGDFLNRSHILLPAGYCEEWWDQELESVAGQKVVENPYKVSIDLALELSRKYKVPLHPRYTFHWNSISKEDLISLLEWLKDATIKETKIVIPLKPENKKRSLELIGLPHKCVANEYVVIEDPWARAFYATLNLENDLDALISKISSANEQDTVGLINRISTIKIRDKSGYFLGVRMGRPEKAKMRKLKGTPHMLFPVGEQGGRMRSLNEALEQGYVRAQFAIYKCENCNRETIYPRCEICDQKTVPLWFCTKCGVLKEKCTKEENGKKHVCTRYKTINLDIKHHFEHALKLLGIKEYPEVIKGIRGTSNKDHTPEHLVKGILRAIYNIHVNKDGTTRYDMTEMAITHFKPKEIGTSIEKLRELGYKKDIFGNELVSEDQILELKCQDIILPGATDSAEEGADTVLFRVANFIDELLVKFYKQEKFYNLKSKEDLVGHLVIALSPHTSAGIIGRIIGFSKTQGFYAHPLFHSIMRRDCLGYDNYITIKENGLWKVIKIGEFVNSLSPSEKVDFFGTLRKKVSNLKTYGNDGEHSVVDVTKHKPRKLLKIHLEDGRKLELTEDHVVYLKGKQEKRAHQLSTGDQLIVSYKKDIDGLDIEEIFLLDVFKDKDYVMIRNVRKFLERFGVEKRTNYYARDSFPIKYVENILREHSKSLKDLPRNAKMGVLRDKISLPTYLPLTKEFLEVVGLYIAEGHMRKNTSKKSFYQVSFAGNNEIKQFVKRVFKNLFGLKPSAESGWSITFSSRLLYELFENLGLGRNAKEKRIPALFLNLKKERLANLLRGYFEGDGSVSTTDVRVKCCSVSEGLIHDLSFALSRFGIYTRIYYEKERLPGKKVAEFYIKKQRKIPKFSIINLIIVSNFIDNFSQIGFLSKRKNKILKGLLKRSPRGTKIELDANYAYPRVIKIEDLGVTESYCLNVDVAHNFFANDILVHNCDGDEAGVMLLMDALLNFSRKLLSEHRGSTQDEPIVLTSIILPSEVDDMVFDMDVCFKYPLSFYEATLQFKHPSEVEIETLAKRLNTPLQYEGYGFTHDTSDINKGVLCSGYKTIPTMEEKVVGQMELAEKIRAVDEADVARLVIDRHFLRDIKGNLRKFSQQEFRCVKCNEKYRRPPLKGICLKCNGRIVFTVSEGSIVKYLGPSLSLAEKYNIPSYLKQDLILTKQKIESLFGKEKEKQEGLNKWFG